MEDSSTPQWVSWAENQLQRPCRILTPVEDIEDIEDIEGIEDIEDIEDIEGIEGIEVM